MYILTLAKVQVICLLLCSFISLLYFTSNRQKNRLHVSFGRILVALPIYLLCDIATVITVNTPSLLGTPNDIAHRCFFVAIILVVYFFCDHMNRLIEAEEGDSTHRKVVLVLENVVLVLAVIYSLTAKAEYGFSDIAGFALPAFAGAAFAAVGIYVVIINVLLIAHWKILPKKKRMALISALVIETIGLYLQIVHTELLLSGAVLTFMMLSFYLTLENPDAVLLEEVAKEKEKADAANASKSAFLSVVSHEIRTPMNAVVGMTDILLRDKGQLNDTQIGYLNNIRNSGNSLIMIVNDLLDQSKIEAGKMELVRAPYELRPMLKDVQMIIENRIGTKPVHLRMDVDERIPVFLNGDSLRIRQILINLMNNAVKFTEEGYVQLSIQCVQPEADKLLLRFSVKDSGQGMKEEDLARVGQAFLQVDVQRNHGKEGTGLGLSISRDFVELMGGRLEVASQYGMGTEFFFSVYQDLVPEEKIETGAGMTPWRTEEEFTAPEASVLFVDDNEMNLTIGMALLEPLKMQIDTANSGLNAIEMLKEKSYDIVFMDYMMPYMDGIEATGAIRRLVLEGTVRDEAGAGADYFKKLPIIAMSADTTEETVERFLKAGIDDFAEKPPSLAQLKKLLLKWLPAERIIREQE